MENLEEDIILSHIIDSLSYHCDNSKPNTNTSADATEFPKEYESSYQLPLRYESIIPDIAVLFVKVRNVEEEVESYRDGEKKKERDSVNVKVKENFESNADSDFAKSQNKLLKTQTQIKDISRVCHAISHGDLTCKLPQPQPPPPPQSEMIQMGDLDSDVIELMNSINSMSKNLILFYENIQKIVIRDTTITTSRIESDSTISLSVPLESRVEGVWRELIECVDCLSMNVTRQIRRSALFMKLLAIGDISKTIDCSVAHGEILAIEKSMNNWIITLREMSKEVTKVKSEICVEGKLGSRIDLDSTVQARCLVFDGNRYK